MTQVRDVLANRYLIERPLARGGMADVFLARDTQLDRQVAIKVLFPEFARDPSFVERFRREAQNAAMLNHANIVSVYDYGQQEGTYFIVMEYVEGQSLREILRSQGRLAPMEAARIAAEIAAALDFAHRHGVVHRDIKPGNVLLTPQGQVRVADFGIAANPTDAESGLTATGAVVGTATYFSPEQAQGYQVDGRTDVYALGVVLYEMLTGRPPFTAESPVAVAMKHVREEPVPPTRLVPDIPPDLERIVLTALAKDVTVRYQSAADLRADLMRFGRGRPLVGAAAAPAMVAPVEPELPTVAAAAPAAQGDIWDDRQHRRAAPMIATGLGLALLIGVIVYALFFLGKGNSGGGSADKVEVPNVVGQTYAQASQAIQNAGFNADRQDELNDAPVDQVISQRPDGGLLLAKGRTVVLVVSAKQVPIPNVVGQTYDDANNALTKLGLLVQRNDQPTADQPANTVTASSPAAGTKVDKGTTVTLTVAQQPPITVPDVRGQDQVQAQTILQNAGFQVSVAPASDPTVPTGKVISTDPPAGAQATKGSTISVSVSTGPATAEIPNVVGASAQSASTALTGAGFNVVIAKCSAFNNVVKTQSPGAGTAPVGTAVTISC
jgi:eukaryotic-like serine/threonine-protein kinase